MKRKKMVKKDMEMGGWAPPPMDTAWDATRFRVAWDLAGLSPTQVAAAVGVTAETMRRWRLGVNEPGAVQLMIVAEMLGVTVNDLLPLRPRRSY